MKPTKKPKGEPTSEVKPYEPTKADLRAVEAYRAAKDTHGPRLKVSIEAMTRSRASPQSACDHRAMRRLPGVTPPMRLKARMNAASDS